MKAKLGGPDSRRDSAKRRAHRTLAMLSRKSMGRTQNFGFARRTNRRGRELLALAKLSEYEV